MTTTERCRDEKPGGAVIAVAIVALLAKAACPPGAAAAEGPKEVPAKRGIVVMAGSFPRLVGAESKAGQRVIKALSSLMRRCGADFSGVEARIRARVVPYGYAATTCIRNDAVIDIDPSVFVGKLRLNQAELYSMLGHELVHARQCGFLGRVRGRQDHRLREQEAYEWELAHMRPRVRDWYRDDTAALAEGHSRKPLATGRPGRAPGGNDAPLHRRLGRPVGLAHGL